MKFPLRSLTKSPGFTVIALFTLALGIGVNTAMFSVVDALLFRAAPYPESNQLVILGYETTAGANNQFSATEIEELRAQLSGFSSLTTHIYSAAAWTEPGRPAERLTGVMLSSEMSDTYRIPPMLGRAFAPGEFEPGKNQVVLLSYDFWRSRFAGDPGVVGRIMHLDGEPVTVIGVMPASFGYKLFWGPVAFWRPLNFTPDQLANRRYLNFLLIGRLSPAAGPGTLLAQLGPLAARLEKKFPNQYSGLHYRVTPLHEAAIDQVSRMLSWTLLGLSGFVLLIACANLANLQLARATTALREFAIRAALGASRSRLVLHQLVECVVLSLSGGILGLVLALWITSALERSILIGGEFALQISIDARVLLVTFGISLLTGLMFGIAPAIFACKVDLCTALKSQTRGATTGRSSHRFRQILIVGEVALALILLAGAEIMNRGFDRFMHRTLGWDSERVLTASLSISETRFNTPEKRSEFYRKVVDRVAALPGVDHAAVATALPIFGYYNDRPIFTDAGLANSPDNLIASHVMTSPDYFATLGIPLREGRLFAPNLENDGPQYIIINESLARHLWPSESAVGKRVGNLDGIQQVVWREVIGVVADVEFSANLGSRPGSRFTVYKPFAQEPWSWANLVVRSSHPSGLVETVRRAVAEVAPDYPLDNIGTAPEIAGKAQHNFVVIARLLAGFAVLGLVLATVGLYGVISHLVALRTSEFGIRLALGAQPRDVLANVLQRGLTLVVAGLVCGAAGAWALGQFLASVVPSLANPSFMDIFGVATLLLITALLACWLPARRATKVDPITALRAE